MYIKLVSMLFTARNLFIKCLFVLFRLFFFLSNAREDLLALSGSTFRFAGTPGTNLSGQIS